MADQGIKFEDWICHTLPWQLNLSASKEVAVKTKFGPFADSVRPLANKAPQEFDLFFSELKKRFSEASKWKAPRGYVVIPEIYKGEFQTFQNGRLRHRLVKK
jgi:hypothetical protein